MKVAAIYDIHGNLPALEAVLSEIEPAEVDLVVVGGDVLPGPMPTDCLDRLAKLDLPTRFILGNGDREVIAQVDGTVTEWYRNAQPEWREPVSWTAGQLKLQHRDSIASWPATIQVEIDGLGRALFCHGTPRSDTELLTCATPAEEIQPVFADAQAELIVCGHTHMQFDRHVGSTRLVNAGSVGAPFGKPGAYWLMLERGVELRRTAYDLPSAVEQIAATTYPEAASFAARVSTPVSEAVMLEVFEQQRKTR